MNTTDRIDTFISTLREARKAGPPATYSSDTPTGKLVTLTGNVSDLCWNVAVATKHSNPANKCILADRIKHDATNIVNICIAELKNLGHTTESAIELIATDGALWFWSSNQHPLDKLDQDVNPVDRLQSINVTTGDLLEWWPNKIAPQIALDLNAERERTFTNLAYEATCAIIAHTH